MKRYTLYKFPTRGGSPIEFNLKIVMYIWVLLFSLSPYVWEYQDNKTGEYKQF